MRKFLETKLKLRVNREKSAVAFMQERKFPGHRLLPGGRLGIALQSLERARGRLRQITGRSRGVSLPEVIGELNLFLTGWVTCFRYAECKSHLQRLGVPEWRAWIAASSGKGWWRLSGSPPITEGMSLAWFASLGLHSLTQRYDTLTVKGNRRIR